MLPLADPVQLVAKGKHEVIILLYSTATLPSFFSRSKSTLLHYTLEWATLSDQFT